MKISEKRDDKMRFNLADNAVTRALSKICDMVCLNILWLVCCIPIVTIGASTTALYSVMLKMVKNEEGYIFRGFFKAFKENFKQSTIMWLLFAVLWIVWWLDFNFAGALPGQFSLVIRAFFLLLGFLLLSVMTYAFPLTARYVNTIGATLKNALILTVAKLPYTFLMILVLVAAVLGSLWNTVTLMFSIPLWFLIGGSLIAWIDSWLLRRVFTVFEGKEQNE